MGIEPTWPAWKAGALPLSYTRSESAGNPQLPARSIITLPRRPASCYAPLRRLQKYLPDPVIPALIPSFPRKRESICADLELSTSSLTLDSRESGNDETFAILSAFLGCVDIFRHSRESGNPGHPAEPTGLWCGGMDSRFRGNDDVRQHRSGNVNTT